MQNVVKPRSFNMLNMSLASLFGKTPMIHVCCGNCGNVFKDRATLQNHPVLRCPGCGVGNKIPIVIS